MHVTTALYSMAGLGSLEQSKAYMELNREAAELAALHEDLNKSPDGHHHHQKDSESDLFGGGFGLFFGTRLAQIIVLFFCRNFIGRQQRLWSFGIREADVIVIPNTFVRSGLGI